MFHKSKLSGQVIIVVVRLYPSVNQFLHLSPLPCHLNSLYPDALTPVIVSVEYAHKTVELVFCILNNGFYLGLLTILYVGIYRSIK
jgi:hypothetical protein